MCSRAMNHPLVSILNSRSPGYPHSLSDTLWAGKWLAEKALSNVLFRKVSCYRLAMLITYKAALVWPFLGDFLNRHSTCGTMTGNAVNIPVIAVENQMRDISALSGTFRTREWLLELTGVHVLPFKVHVWILRRNVA